MIGPAFTILLAIHRPPHMLPFAVASVLGQQRRDFELFIICDGAPPETVSCAEELSRTDPRIKVFVHAKGARSGELYRDQALQQARGRFVCHIGDDDLWLPNHLSEMEKLLEAVDFGNVLHVEVDTGGEVAVLAGDLGNSETRRRMLDRTFNIFGLTAAGYRLAAYRALPVGWSPAPADVAVDLHMWRKFLAQTGLRFGTRAAVTSVKFAAGSRRDWSIERRAAEVADWAPRVSDPDIHAFLTQRALQRLNAMADRLERGSNRLQAKLQLRVETIERLRTKLRVRNASWSWRLTRPLRRIRKLLAR